MDKVLKTWQLLTAHKLALAQLLALIYGPFYLAYYVSVSSGLLPEEAADKLFGLFGVVVMPVVNGCLVWLARRWYDGEEASVGDALRAVPSYWSRLLTAYISISFILLGWLAVTVLPAYIVLMVLKVQQPLYLLPVAAAAVVAAVSRYAFIDPLVVTDNLGPWHARRRSSELVRGRRWAVIGFGVLTYSLPLALELSGELSSQMFSDKQEHTALLISTASGIVAAVLYIVPVLFFYAYYRSLSAGSPEERSSLIHEHAH